MSQGERSTVEQAWDEAALGYDAYFGPRFVPYLGVGVGALLARSPGLPHGSILVPCVGPGRELGPLARAFPDRQIVASDLSSQMVELARARNAGLANLSVERADATALSAPSEGAAALLSVFGLQLLPNQPATLASWVSLLVPGGLAVVVYWPRVVEASGPFQIMHRLLRDAGMRDDDWESELVPSALAVGAQVLLDVRVAFEMQHEDAPSMWHALTQLGPLRGLALARGQGLVAQLGAEFVAELPPGALTHTPEARLLVIERR